MCKIFTSIMYTFRGEKSEYENEFVVRTTRAVNTWHSGGFLLPLVCYKYNKLLLCLDSGVFSYEKIEVWKRSCPNAAHTGVARGGHTAKSYSREARPAGPVFFSGSHCVSSVTI